MRYCLRTLLILLGMAWPLKGCGRNSIPPVPPNTATTTPVAVQSGAPARYSLEVRSDSGSSQESVSGNVDVTTGNVHLRIQDGALTVNGRSYGKLNGGDAVLIESDGQVLVNLEVREPW